MAIKKIEWQVILKDGKIAIVEKATGFSNSSAEDNLAIIGILEDIKKHHLDKINNLFNKTVGGNNE